MNSRKSKTLWALSSMLSFLQALPLPACAALYRTLANGAPVGSVPSGINYQGRLIDNGFPVSGVRNMTFRLYDAALGGNLLWTSNVQSVTVSQGIFGTTLAISTSALAGTSQRYLEVQVEGTTLIPREPLNSVPYALIAKSVEESLVMSSVTVEGQLTSSGPMSLTTLTAVDGLAGITITTSAFFTAGRVGLGTTSPSAQLHLSAQAGASSLRIDGTSDAMIDLIRNLNNSAYLYFGNATTGSQVAQVGWNGALASADFHTAGYAYPMLLNASNVSLQTGAGNVGVGTTNPATKLHMSSGTLTIDGTSPAVSVGVSTFVVTAGGNVGIGISGPGQKLSVAGTIESFSGGFKFPDGNTQATAAGAGASYWGASGLDIYSSNSGKVGIGISAPGTKLDARGANAKAATAAYENVFQSASNDAANPLTLRMGIKTDATAGNRYGGIEVDDAAAERALVLQPGSGSVGIGVTNPQSKVDVEGGMAVGATYSGASAAPANGMIVEGSVGIGLTSPGYKLDVSGGDINTTYNLRASLALYAQSATLSLAGNAITLSGAGANINFSGAGLGQIITAGGQNLALMPGGSVGIGVATPQNKLDVEGSMAVGAAYSGLNAAPTNGLIVEGGVGIGLITPGAKLDVAGNVKLGTAGTAFTAAGACTIAAAAISATANVYTCTGVPASTAVAVWCSGSAAMTTPNTTALYCRPNGTVNTIVCNTTAVNAIVMNWTCMWMQP